jgi:isoleucyl-tRNA synthetase
MYIYIYVYVYIHEHTYTCITHTYIHVYILLTLIALRKKAAEFAKETINTQRDSFMRYGVWGDWDNPYATLQPVYEAAQIKVFGQMVAKGHIYRYLMCIYIYIYRYVYV